MLPLILGYLLLTGAAVSVDLPPKLQARLDAVESELVPSGILRDRALPLTRWEEWDGSETSPVASAGAWRQLVHELRRAGAPLPSDLPRRARQVTAVAGPIPIALVSQTYEALTPAAIHGTELDLRPQTLRSQRLFVAAALQDRTTRGERVEFVLSSGWSQLDGPPPAVELDLDDGRGLRTVPWDEPIVAAYDLAGRRTLQLRAAGRTARFIFDVRALRLPAPDDTLTVTASIPHQGQLGRGEAYVYLAPGHSDLTRPAVVVEGFDLDNSMNWDELYLLLNDENLLEDLRAEGFDTVVLNFTEATAPIQENAMVLVELLQQIEARAGPAPIPLAGASMGGLVSRYALSYLESLGIPHRVQTWLAFDTPHGGANIPLGIQYWLAFFQDLSAEAGFLLSRLDTPAARQMLLTHHTSPPGPTGTPDPLRAQFLADLANVGGFPLQPRTVAVANGSGLRQDQGFAPGAQIIHYEYDSLLADITGNVWAVPDQTPATDIFDGSIWVFLLVDTSQRVTVDATSAWDGAPGGWRGSMAQMDATPAPYGDIVAQHDNHCFIPTISALALDVTDPFYDVLGDPDLLSRTPFDAVYVPTQNQPHVDVTPENKAWIVDEFRSVLTDAPERSNRSGLRLLASIPNPFNPATAIRYRLESTAPVTVEVFDARGRRVDQLLHRALRPPGLHRLEWTPRGMASGVYLLRVSTPDVRRVGRIVLLK